MNESDLKRYLIRSIRLQGGVGHRIEDKFKVGWPDMIMIPDSEPVFFVEVKLVKGARLICTELQEERLGELYADSGGWARKAILNVAGSGKFSSDRTIAEYATGIWGVKPCPVS